MEITKNDLIKLWSSGDSITIDNVSYTTHRMSYGQYFMERSSYILGETMGFDSQTLWARLIDSKSQLYKMEA